MPKKNTEPESEPQALAVVQEQHEERNLPAIPPVQQRGPYGMSTITLNEKQVATLMAPAPEDLLEFRWGDAEMSYALAYVSWVECSRRWNAIAGPLGWGMDYPEKPIMIGDTVIVLGVLYVFGCKVACAYGENDYNAENGNMSYATAVEAAMSNALTRCSKHAGMFLELWDKKNARLQHLSEEWVKANRFDCPNCKKALYQDRKDKTRWFCWQRKGGCGKWEGVPTKNTGAAVAAPPADVLPQDKRQSPTPQYRTPQGDNADQPVEVTQPARPVPTAEKWGLPSNKKVEQAPAEDPVQLAALAAQIATVLNDKLFDAKDRKEAHDRIARDPAKKNTIKGATGFLAVITASLAKRQAEAEKAKRIDAGAKDAATDARAKYDDSDLPF